MSNKVQFEKAMQKLRKWEGGLSNHLDDRGGKTFCGITKRHHPDWPGWKLVDNLLHTIDIKATNALVDEFYRKEYWAKICGDELPTQALADALFGFSVNLGVGSAVRMLQGMLRVSKDGIMGPETLKATQTRGASKLFLQSYLDRVGKYYLDIVANQPAQKVFLAGWQNRLDDYKVQS